MISQDFSKSWIEWNVVLINDINQILFHKEFGVDIDSIQPTYCKSTSSLFQRYRHWSSNVITNNSLRNYFFKDDNPSWFFWHSLVRRKYLVKYYRWNRQDSVISINLTISEHIFLASAEYSKKTFFVYLTRL